jgi:Nucleoside 2-deoxyribosyltransferase
MADSADTALSAHTTDSASVISPKSLTYYHAGPLFSISDLNTNSLLSRAISQRSNSKYIPILPQDIEQRDTSPHAIRDQDIRALLSSDLALFIYDGTELDSGAVVEFMFAKMADIPAVIVRTDFRGAGDQDQGSEGGKGDPWNLMSSFYPRTERVIVNSMAAYKQGLTKALRSSRKMDQGGFMAGEYMIEETADAIIAAFEAVVKEPAVLSKDLRRSVYEWLAVMPGLRDGGPQNVEDMLKLCSSKAAKGLL